MKQCMKDVPTPHRLGFDRYRVGAILLGVYLISITMLATDLTLSYFLKQAAEEHDRRGQLFEAVEAVLKCRISGRCQRDGLDKKPFGDAVLVSVPQKVQLTEPTGFHMRDVDGTVPDCGSTQFLLGAVEVWRCEGKEPDMPDAEGAGWAKIPWLEAKDSVSWVLMPARDGRPTGKGATEAGESKAGPQQSLDVGVADAGPKDAGEEENANREPKATGGTNGKDGNGRPKVVVAWITNLAFAPPSTLLPDNPAAAATLGAGLFFVVIYGWFVSVSVGRAERAELRNEVMEGRVFLVDAMRLAVSHDIGNELAPILQASESIDDPPLRRKIQERIAHANGVLEEMAKTNFVEITSEKATRGDLAALARGLVEEMASERSRSGVQYEGEPVIYTSFRPRGARRAIMNCIVNAEKHGDGLREVRVKRVPGGVAVEVTDAGPGIPTDRRESMFGIFERGDPAARGPKGGSGLGLWIVREIMRVHEGCVEMDEPEGGGLTVRLTFPSGSLIEGRRRRGSRASRRGK